MPQIPRRIILGGVFVGLAGGVAAIGSRFLGDAERPSAAAHVDPAKSGPRVAIAEENRLPGSDAWRVGKGGSRAADDRKLQISGYAAQTSVEVGETLDFHISVAQPTTFTVEVYRFGHYGGIGARRVATTGALPGTRQPTLIRDADTGMISCPWQPSWTLHVPETWTTGYYLAVFTTKAGYRSYTPFIVRDSRRTADFCVIVPMTTYQAYNLWPSDGVTGKSLYYGFSSPSTQTPTPSQDPLVATGTPKPKRPLDADLRARKVSFLRPYSNRGLPSQSVYDISFVQWAEAAGYSLTYATSIDLHAGRVDPAKYAGLIFSGHDEYWSTPMRQQVTKAVQSGVSLIFMSANNLYWRIRVEDGPSMPDSTVVCYRRGDPTTDRAEATCRWRDTGVPLDPEQTLLGVQFNGIVAEPAPLVVQAADHWFWKGTGVHDGESIPGIVGGEADGLNADLSAPAGFRQTLLSASPYHGTTGGTAKIQNTSVCEADNGTIVFVAGSLTWPKALAADGNSRIQRASANVLDRVARRRRT